MTHISEIIENILVEWAYRVHDGMPNPKNALHIQQLRESMEELNLPNKVIYEVIQNLINEDTDDKYVSIGYGRYKLKGKEKNPDADVFTKTDTGKYVKSADQTSDDEKPKTKQTKIDANPFDKEDDEEEPKDDEKPSEEQSQKEKEKQEFLLDMTTGLLETSSEISGEGRFNMSKDDLGKYKSYLEGNKPEIPNYDISDDEVDEVIGILKSTLGENYQKFVQRVKKKGDPPKQYSTGDAGKERVFSCLKHYMSTGGRSTITGEFVPFSESQLDHVTSLDNGGVDGPENWEWMESRFNQFKGALSDEDVMNKIKSDLDKSPDEDKLKQLNQSFRKYSKEAFINYYSNKFKDGGTAGITEESLKSMTGKNIEAMIKGWNKNNPEGTEFFIPRYGSKKDDTGKAIDRKSGRASGGRIASKPELISRFLEKSKASGVDIPTKTETDSIDKDFEIITDELNKQKGEISNLKQKIKTQKAEQ